jgi:RNA polymerase sigma-70 factor (ECF subfamily)
VPPRQPSRAPAATRFANPGAFGGVERTVDEISGQRERDIRTARAVAEGDPAAFEALVRANADTVYGHCLRFFSERTAAEDATQEVFLKVLRQAGSYDGRAAFSTWLYRLTHNTCLDLARAASRRPVSAELTEVPDRPGADPMAVRDEADAIRRAMATLPPDERDAISAVGLYEMSYAEAAEALGVAVGTVKSRVFRARKALVEALSERGGR